MSRVLGRQIGLSVLMCELGYPDTFWLGRKKPTYENQHHLEISFYCFQGDLTGSSTY